VGRPQDHADGLRLELLGQVRAWRGDRELDLGRPKQRALLAVLLLRRDELVSRDVIVDQIWGDDPPASAANLVHTYVSGLRKALAAENDQPLVAGGSGYRLAAGRTYLDLVAFDEAVGEARRLRAEGALTAAAEAYADALRLWRGDPLGGVSGAFVERERRNLTDRYLTAVEEAAEVRLDLGAQAELVADLSALAAAHPTRERVHLLLMLALYRSGQQAEALAVYRELRTLLVDEYAVEPGVDLRRLHEQVLRQDPSLAAPVRPTEGHDPVGVPAELPADVFGFTAREKELSRLDALAVGGAPVVVVSGTAGVGKTALAVRWARLTAAGYPDGCLYVDLRGYHADQPLPPTEALAGFLRALGVDARRIPRDLGERAARYRSLLASRRMLVILDNAHSSEQVVSLLPGTGSSYTLVTSRDSLAGLAARTGASRIDLDVFDVADAVALLGSRVPERVETEPEAAEALARLCAGLPLALAVAAEVARSRRTTTLHELVTELTDEKRRLDLLDAGEDPGTAVRAVFSWSYRHLDAAAARLFRLGGLHPGPDLDVIALAALAGTGDREAAAYADVLVRAHLWVEISTRRFGMHDLLRLYAREQAEVGEPADERDLAIRRLLLWYLNTAAAAEKHFTGKRRDRELEQPAGGPPPLRFADQSEAMQWCENERANLVAAAALAYDRGDLAIAWQLPTVLGVFFYLRKYWTDWLATHRTALDAAERLGDQQAVANVATNLGNAYYDLEEFKAALTHHRRAYELRCAAGDSQGQAISLLNQGEANRGLGQHHAALAMFHQALDLFRETDDRYGEAMALSNMGNVYRELDRLTEALDHTERALAIRRGLDDRHGESFTLNSAGDIYRMLGRYDEAVQALNEARQIRQQYRDRHNEAVSLCSLAEVMMDRGDPRAAREYWTQAIAMLRELDQERAEVVRRRMTEALDDR